MSTCPNKDGYSVYLDGEIPAEYQTIYTKHLENCSQCKDGFNTLQKLQSILREDAQGIRLSETALENSYLNLQKLIKFQTNTKNTSQNNVFRTIRHALPAIAAALIIGIFIPIKYKQAETDSFVPNLHAINPTARLITSKGIIADTSLSNALQNISENASTQNFEFNPDMLNAIDIFRPSTLNETSSIKIKIFDTSDTLPKAYSGLYQASFVIEGRY